MSEQEYNELKEIVEYNNEMLTAICQDRNIPTTLVRGSIGGGGISRPTGNN